MRKMAMAWLCAGLVLWPLLSGPGTTGLQAEGTPFHPSRASFPRSDDRWIYDSLLASWTPIVPSVANNARSGMARERALAGDLPISMAAGWQMEPTVVWNSARDEFLVVWEDFRNGGDRDIYGQRMLGDGHLAGDNFAVVIGEHDQTDPGLLYNSTDGGYLLLWHLLQQGNYRVFCQRLSAAGTPLGSPAQIPSPQGRQQWIPGGAYNSVRNEYLVVWEDVSSAEIVGQRMAGSGEALGGSIIVSGRPQPQWTPPFVTFNPVWDEYLVVWDDLQNCDVFGQIVTADGEIRGENVAITTAPGRQFASDVIYNEARDEYLVVWTDERNLDAQGSDVYCQRVSGGGLLLGEEQAVSGAPGWQQDCVGRYDSSHEEYVLVWWDGRERDTANDVYGQRVSANGPLLGSNFALSAGSRDQVYPSLARTMNRDQYAVVWQEWYAADDLTMESDIVGMLFSPLRFTVRLPWVPRAWLQDDLALSRGR